MLSKHNISDVPSRRTWLNKSHIANIDVELV